MMNNSNSDNKSLSRSLVYGIGIKISECLFNFLFFTYGCRVLSSASIGNYSFSQSVVEYFMLLSSLGVSIYAVREGSMLRNDLTALRKLVSEIYTINILMTVVSFVFMGVLCLIWFGNSEYNICIWIVSLSIIFTTIGADWLNQIFEDFQYIFYRDTIVRSVLTVIMFLKVRDEDDVYWYILILVLSTSGIYLVNRFRISKRIKLSLTSHLQLAKHIKPLFTLFSNQIATVIYLNSDITMLGAMHSNEEVGIYTYAAKLYSTLKALINSLVFAALPRFSYFMGINASDEFESKAKELISSLLLLLLPACTGIYMCADGIIFIITGGIYERGQAALEIFAVAMFFAVAACFVTQVILVTNRLEKINLQASVFAALVNIGLNIAAIPRYGLVGAAVTTLIAEIIIFTISIISGSKIIRIRNIIDIKDTIASVIGCIVIVVVCHIVNFWMQGIWQRAVASIIFSCIGYALVVIVANHSIVRKAMLKLRIR